MPQGAWTTPRPTRVGRGQAEETSRPGAAISILPKFENEDGLNVGSREATAMIVGEFAGALGSSLGGRLAMALVSMRWRMPRMPRAFASGEGTRRDGEATG